MASILHLGAGAVCGAAYARATDSEEPAKAIAGGALLALSPDLDLLTLYLGGLGTPLEHRVMTHALPFAVVVGPLLGLIHSKGWNRVLAGLLATVALVSHGLLDALSTSEPGPQLLWPFLPEPLTFSWRPIPGLESFQDYFLVTGLPVLLWEAAMSLPLVAVALWLVFPAVGARALLPTRRSESTSGD